MYCDHTLRPSTTRITPLKQHVMVSIETPNIAHSLDKNSLPGSSMDCYSMDKPLPHTLRPLFQLSLTHKPSAYTRTHPHTHSLRVAGVWL